MKLQRKLSRKEGNKMSNKNKKQKINVLSFWNSDGYRKKFNKHTLVEHDIFIEMQAYAVDIHTEDTVESQLDVFEDAILKLIALLPMKIRNLEEVSELLAEKLCLRVELVRSVCQSLEVKNFLQLQVKDCLTVVAKSYLQESLEKTTDRYRQVDKKVSSYGTVYVHRSFGGKTMMMPYINIKDTIESASGRLVSKSVRTRKAEDDTEEYEQRYDAIRVGIGSQGNEKTLDGFLFSCDQIMLECNDLNNRIEKQIPKFNRYIEQHKQKTGGRNTKINICMMSQGAESSTVYFHFKLAILDGDADTIVISDGITNGSSEQYAFILEGEVYQHVLQYLNDYATEEKVFTGKALHAKAKESKSVGKYPDIKIPKPIQAEGRQTKDEYKKMWGENQRRVVKYYGAIESALHKHVEENGCNAETIAYIYRNNAENLLEISLELQEIAKNMGIHTEGVLPNIFMANHKEIFAYDTHKEGTLETCIAIVLFCTRYAENKTLLNLIEKFPSFLQFLTRLKMYRNAFGHADVNGAKDKKTSLEKEGEMTELYENTVKLIHLLLPEYEQSKVKKKLSDKKENVSQELVNENNKISEYISISKFRSYGDDMKDLMRSIVKEDRDPQSFINDSYKLFELALKMRSQELLRYMPNNFQPKKEEIILKLEELCGEVPHELRSVREQYFNDATIPERGSSLGAVTLCYCAVVDYEILELPSFLKFIGELLSLRGHGNNFNINSKIGKTEMEEMEKIILTRIKQCMEKGE